MKKNKDNQKIREGVDKFYRKISEGEYRIKVNPEKLSESLGYDREMLGKLPKNINLGLSCGNPLDNLQLKKNETLLDLGCGTGVDIFLARLKYPDSGMIYGIDRLQEMIDKAEKTKSKKKFRNIEFKKGMLTSLPFDNNMIDKIISNCVINLEPDKQKVYDEIYRVLKDGGRFFISDILLKRVLPDEWRQSEKFYST